MLKKVNYVAHDTPDSKMKFGSPYQFFLEPSFYTKLRELKVHEQKLNSENITIQCNFNEAGLVSLNSKSFERQQPSLALKGFIKNFNTLEEFKNLDKVTYLNSVFTERFEKTTDLNDLCSDFLIISFAELKKYTLIYWTATPCYHIEGVTFSMQRHSTIKRDYNIFENLNLKQFVVVQENKIYLRNLFKDYEHIPSYVKNIIIKLFYQTKKTTYEIFLIQKNIEDHITIDLNVPITPVSNSQLKVTGWSRNMTGKLSPKFVDLSSMLDPFKMNEQSVDLNLQLMKWRIQPELDLNIIQQQRVLLLGSGTLGCYVARALMAWGVKNITFVDNGTVSHSNPVRQPLFNFEDVGEYKAQVAATNLKKVFPAVNADYRILEITMIGHSITNEETQKQNYLQLEALIMKHDVIFLLMDSRETRWLPTVLGKAHNKLVMNAALGFDSYLVMRHGTFENKLGCYFCNDIVAPSDSLKDRTLDQMCTVTRPGCALMASSIAAEMMVTSLQSAEKDGRTCLGDPTPHQIRGFLNSYTNIKLETPEYKHCSACSSPILNTYKEDGWEFVKSAVNDYTIVENISGLTKVQREAEERMNELSLDEFSDDFDDDFVN